MNEQYTIQLEGEDTKGHAVIRFVPDDEDWVQSRLGTGGGIRLRAADDDDTEGHLRGPAVRVVAIGDDDTEGHAMSLKFPTMQEADAFRRRLLATGMIVGTLALGTAGGIAVADQLGEAGTAGVSGATANQSYQEAAANEAARQGAGAAAVATSADEGYHEAAANEAARQAVGATSAGEGYQEAANEAARKAVGATSAGEGYQEAANEAARQAVGATSAGEGYQEAANERPRRGGGAGAASEDTGPAEQSGLTPR